MKTYQEAYDSIFSGVTAIPEGFKDWKSRCPVSGDTIAHTLVKLGMLKEDFHLWGILNSSKETVAHVGAEAGTLPKTYEFWDLTNKVGDTVGHVAARHNTIPKYPVNFNYNQPNHLGETPKELAKKLHGRDLVISVESYTKNKRG